jgi:aldehyde:ferredoxin oxidoreductase|tara:strand:- start:43 stop:1788 length:1746 start_codon:yes stop_codon:yes gene_type:complete
MKGFYKNYLDINLDNNSVSTKKISSNICKTWLSGKGLSTYFLFNLLKPGIDPLSDENILIFSPGIAAGTIPGSSRYGVFSKSPLTNGYGESYSGGSLAPAFKRTGYDAVIIRKKASTPIYLVINNNGATFHDASGFMGLNTDESEIGVLKEVNEKRARALTIGPAGENLVRFACITNDIWRNAGRCGMGAVMGSKNLKAIVFHGEKKPEFHDADGIREFSRTLRKRGKEDRGVENLKKYGTPNMVKVLNHLGGFPTKYWSEGKSNSVEKISADYLIEDMGAKPNSCYNCFISCGKLVTVKKGVHKGIKIEGPEYETAFAFGGLCAIENLENVAYLNDVCDKLGIDTISAGSIVALVMEASKRNLLKDKLKYGDEKGAAKILEAITYRKDIGNFLADGIKIAGEKLNLNNLIAHVKGLDFPGYDPRVLKGMGLGYGTSARGACHLRGVYYKAELSGKSPHDLKEKTNQYVEYEDIMTIFDSIILCKFYWGLTSNQDLCELIKKLTGIEYNLEGLKEMSNRIITTTREFNIREGFSKVDDALPKRFHDEKLDGRSLEKKEYDTMLQEYYKLRNWNENGIPIKK